MHNISILILVSMVAITMTGCSHYDPNLGASVKHNQQVQAISPYALYEEGTVAAIDGQKAEKLLKDYRKEESEVDTQTLIQELGK